MGTDDWCTSPEFEECLYNFHGGPVGLDPCSNDRSIIRARRRYTAGGRHLPWDEDSTFENPPFSMLREWTEYGIEQLKTPTKSGYRTLVRLVPATPSTEWWLRMLTAKPLLVFTKRLPFINEQGVVDSGARFDCVAPLLHGVGAKKRDIWLDREQFKVAFEPLTRWVVEVDKDMAKAAEATLERIKVERAERRASRKKGS